MPKKKDSCERCGQTAASVAEMGERLVRCVTCGKTVCTSGCSEPVSERRNARCWCVECYYAMLQQLVAQRQAEQPVDTSPGSFLMTLYGHLLPQQEQETTTGQGE